jgi:hypothetical protein
MKRDQGHPLMTSHNFWINFVIFEKKDFLVKSIISNTDSRNFFLEFRLRTLIGNWLSHSNWVLDGGRVGWGVESML